MKNFLFFLILICCFQINGQNTSTQTKPNILWIMIEDWSTDLSCYGTKGIETPFIDQLASEGARYTNAYTTAPVCSASRSAMMTGFYQNYIGAEQHRTKSKDKKPLPKGIKPITQELSEVSYYTIIGNKTDLNFLYEGALCDTLVKRVNAKNINKLWEEKPSDKPFFMQLTLAGTHRSWKRDPINPIDKNLVEIPPYYPDTDLIRRDWANGYEQMQLVDREVGLILNKLDEAGLKENTVVIFSSDHGRCHIRAKQFLYEDGLHIPLIIRDPKQFKKNTVITDLTSSLDISKTILDIAGATPTIPLQGKNLYKSENKNREYLFAARDKMDDTHDAMRSVRSKKYRYILNLMPERAYCQFNNYKETKYPALAVMNVMNLKEDLNDAQRAFMATTKPEEELYDLENDPHQINNLAFDSEYLAIKTELRNVLEDWRLEINDKGVSDEFRATGTDLPYPTKSLEEWELVLEAWKPYVKRTPDENIQHPFKKKKK